MYSKDNKKILKAFNTELEEKKKIYIELRKKLDILEDENRKLKDVGTLLQNNTQ